MPTHRFALPLLFASVLLPGTAAAGVANGSFADGFSGWHGLLGDTGGPPATSVDDPAASSFYSLPGAGLAQLQFDATDFDVFIVELYQAFSFADLDEPIAVQFQWDWQPSDGSADSFQILLEDGLGTTYSFIDSLFGTPPDNSAAAAEPLRTDSFLIPAGFFSDPNLRFSAQITDFDYVITDTLRVGNLSITSVPAPAPVALLALGGLALARVRRRR